MQHEAYKQKYREIQIKMHEGAGPLLIEVARNPRCIQYIRDIDFEYCFDNIRVPLTEDIMSNLTLALLQQPSGVMDFRHAHVCYHGFLPCQEPVVREVLSSAHPVNLREWQLGDLQSRIRNGSIRTP